MKCAFCLERIQDQVYYIIGFSEFEACSINCASELPGFYYRLVKFDSNLREIPLDHNDELLQLSSKLQNT